jgi:hypothetical protein
MAQVSTPGHLAVLVATIHNRSAALGFGVACAGVAMFLPSLLGYFLRGTARGQRLQQTTKEERHGVPFADHRYYQMRWAGRTALIGVGLIVVGLIWFVAAGA